MEVALNVAWLSIAAGAFIAFMRLGPRDRRQFQFALGALLCVSVLLLPAISITDDLHFDTFTLEDSNIVKRLANDAHPCPTSGKVWTGISLLALLFAMLHRNIWRHVKERFESLPDFPYHHCILGRAPPLSL
jgi:hypothetical protein